MTTWPPTFQGTRTDASIATPASHAADHTALDAVDQAIVAKINLFGFWVDDYVHSGDTSDDAAAQRAVDAAAEAGGGDVIFTLNKRYLFNSTVTINHDFVQIVGHRGGFFATGTTIIKGADVTLFAFVGTLSTRRIYTGIRDLTLNGNATINPTWVAPLATADYCSEWHHDNLHFENANGPGIVARSVWDSYWRNLASDSTAGKDGASPVIILTHSIANDANTNNIYIVNGRLSNFGDGAIWGVGSSAHPTNLVKLVNTSFETHQPLRGDIIKLIYCQDWQAVNSMIDASAAPDTGFTGMTLLNLAGGVVNFQSTNLNITAVGTSGADFSSLIRMDSTVASNSGATFNGVSTDSAAPYPAAVFESVGTQNSGFSFTGGNQSQTVQPIPWVVGSFKSSAIQWAGGRVTFSNAAYAMSVGDRYVAQTGTLTAARTVTLPTAASVPAGTRLALIDESGSPTSANVITWSPAGSDTWIGANASAPPTIAAPYGRLEAVSDGVSKWFLLRNGINYQEFTAPGTATWYKPPGATMIQGTLIGGGAGGGSGRRGAAGTVRCGGGGGSPGPITQFFEPASYFGATETVTVGATANGGPAQTLDDHDGSAGTAGNPTSISGTPGGGIQATGNGAGQGGTATNGGVGAAGFGTIPSTQGGAASGTGGSGGSTPAAAGSAGGGAGGGITSGDTANNGSDGGPGSKLRAGGVTSAGTHGTVDATIPTVGNPTAGGATFTFGSGGGGGAASKTTTAQSGADGGFYGGGGGGGGASLNGNNSGAGGKGQQGYALIATLF